MGFLFFDKVAGWVSVTLPKLCIPWQVRFKVFAQICCYLSKFRDILGKFISQKNIWLWLLTVKRFSKYSFPQKLYIQGRALESEKI